MRLPSFDYREPTTLEEVFSIIAENGGGARLLAGGTDIIPLMKYGLELPSTIVTLRSVADLKGIIYGEDEIFVGAMTPLADLLSAPVIKDGLAALHEAAKAVAAPPIWNVATVGGNLCQNNRCLYYNQSKAWRLERPPCLKAGGKVCHAVPKGKKCFSVYSGDLAPALIALESNVIIKGKDQKRTIPLKEIFTGNGLAPFGLKRDEVVAGIVVPMPAKRSGSSYVKMRVRAALDYPLLSVAASVTLDEQGKFENVHLVLGAVGPRPVVVEADRLFAGNSIDAVDFAALDEILRKGTQMVDNLTLPGWYRRKMLPVIGKRAIHAAVGSALGKENI
jgi:4-hydroxybenzoyl-CoA reductase beta subunit